MTYITHVTITTGHTTRSQRAEVDDSTLKLLVPWLNQALLSGGQHPLPIGPLSHYSALASVEGGALVVTVFAPLGPHRQGVPFPGQTTPLVTMGVVQRSRQAGLWPQLVKLAGVEREAPAGVPWCGVVLHLAALAAHRDAATWLGDFERCVAWAWITRNPGLEAV